MSLVLTRKESDDGRPESTIVFRLPGGAEITLRVLKPRSSQVRVAIDAPPTVKIWRAELLPLNARLK